MKQQMIALATLVLGGALAHGGEISLGGSNYVLGQGVEPPGLTFGLDRVAFNGNGTVDMTPYGLEGRLGDIEGFEFYVTDPHTAGWTWFRMDYHDGTDWVPLVSFVLDDANDDPYMTHAEWPNDDGYDDGWTAWGGGSYGMSVDRIDANGDGTPDGWEVYQVDENWNWNLVHTYSWDSLPDAAGPGNVSLNENTLVRFYELGMWDATEAMDTFAVWGGNTLPTVRFGPLQSPDGSLIRNVEAASENVGSYVVAHYGVGVAMHPERGYRTIASLPAYLDGAEGIKTSHSDRGFVGDLLTVELTAPAEVYVAWDDRCTEATWLIDHGWTLMPEVIDILEDGDAPTRQIWRKSFKAGTVTLSGPECDGRSNLFVMAVPAPWIIEPGYDSGAGQFTLTWASSSDTGTRYTVERAMDLAGGWTTIAENLVSEGEWTSHTDMAAPAAGAFYRVVAFPPQVLFKTGFEPVEDLTGWEEVIVTGETQWEVGIPTTGPGTAHSGVHVLATKLHEDYGLSQEVSYRSPVIDLTGRQSATLEFFTYYEFEPLEQGTAYDWGDVNLLDAATGENLLPAAAIRLTGEFLGWHHATYSLPAEALGKPIRVEFKLIADELNSREGWYIDDLRVY